jgi:glutaredoxin
MRVNGLAQLPVVGANGELRGMVYDIDLLNVLMD